ncbi:hypothetical protein DRN73_01730 [Candidatus Pacearchaeota archaeon]|nr:MAG: hypothetical protein DRN73_01730 [Candidatus Pacearchaeota archaeon]
MSEILSFLINWGYLGLFIGTILEGTIVALIGGVFISMNILNWYYVLLVIIGADIIADLLGYATGYLGRKKILIRIFNFLKIPEEKLFGFDEFFKKHGGKSVFTSKFITGAGMGTLISAGIARMPLKRFLYFSIPASFIKSAAYIGIGYFFGSLYKVINQWMNTIGAIITVIILLMIFIVMIKKRLKRKSKSKNIKKTRTKK